MRQHVVDRPATLGANHSGELRFQRALDLSGIPDETDQQNEQDQERRQCEDRVISERRGPDAAFIVAEVREDFPEEGDHGGPLPRPRPEEQHTKDLLYLRLEATRERWGLWEVTWV